jgi:hypothetical protein
MCFGIALVLPKIFENMKIRLFAATFVLLSFLLQAKNKKDKSGNRDNLSWIEAHVIESGDCGYLLQLSNGTLLQPQTILPKKFRENHLKVWIRFSEINPASNACNSTKTIAVTEIKKHRNSGVNRAKY